jgi:hypothetical protein
MKFHKPSYPVDVILSMAATGVSRFQIDSYDLKITENVRLFSRKGIVCDVCGVKGKHFRVSRVKKQRPHLVLENQNGTIMTYDHSIPLCAGGKDTYENGIPLCNKCNQEWKSQFDTKISDKTLGIIRLTQKDMI